MESLHLWFYLLCILPSVIIAGLAVYFFHRMSSSMNAKTKNDEPSLKDNVVLVMLKSFMDKEERLLSSINKSEHRKTILPLQLQAYERVILFLERISPPSLILRVNKKGMSSFQLQTAMISAIREEFEHNLSQQLYVSSEVWTTIRVVKEEMIRTINTAAAANEENENASGLATRIIEMVENSDRFSVTKALEMVKADAHKILF